MGRRSAYPAAPQNVCDAVKRKDIVCLPARSHAFNHEAKMLARKGIFAKPSIPQTHLWCVEASAVKNCIAILPADIIPRSKNVCLHKHFREAVNAESVPQARLGAKPPEAAKQHPTKAIIP